MCGELVPAETFVPLAISVEHIKNLAILYQGHSHGRPVILDTSAHFLFDNLSCNALNGAKVKAMLV
jgi:hypothetical protein